VERHGVLISHYSDVALDLYEITSRLKSSRCRRKGVWEESNSGDHSGEVKKVFGLFFFSLSVNSIRVWHFLAFRFFGEIGIVIIFEPVEELLPFTRRIGKTNRTIVND